ncbi:MAG: MFS transporter [Myxococcota bacterium]
MSRTVRLYYLFRGLSSAFLFKVFLVFFYLERGMDFAHIGILHSIFSATVILFEIPTGLWADKYGRRSMMGYGTLLMSMAAMGYYFAHDFAVFALIEVVFAFGLTLTNGADSAFLYDSLKENKKEKLYIQLEGTASFSKHTGIAVSALLGGFIAHYSLSALFPATSLIIFMAFLTTRLMKKTPVQGKAFSTEERRNSSVINIQRGLKVLRNKKAIWWTIFYSATLYIMIRSSDVLLQPVLKKNGFDYWKIGLLSFGGAVVAALSAQYSSRFVKKAGSFFVMWFIPLIMILSYLFFTFESGVILGILILANLGIQGFYSPYTKFLLNSQIRQSHYRATLLSLESCIKRLLIVLVMPIVGVIVDARGLNGGIIFLVIFASTAVAILFFTIPGILDHFRNKLSKSGKKNRKTEGSVKNYVEINKSKPYKPEKQIL